MKLPLRITELLIIVVVIIDCGVFGDETNSSTATINNDMDQYNNGNKNNGCDESKCVSTGLDGLFNDSFTCYADVTTYDPMMCADGYKPHIVEKEPAIDSTYQYFTCCPPNLSYDADVSRHCSNSTSIKSDWENPSNKTFVCEDTTKPYPRSMKENKDIWYGDESLLESYVCCDSIISDHTSNYLDEIECVPYYKEYYVRSGHRNNTYGSIRPAFCDEPDGSGFKFPKYVEYNKTSSAHPFECCKTGPGSPPYIQDYYFIITVYPQIAISAIAVISSMVLIIALLIPLLFPLQPADTIADNGRRNTRTSIADNGRRNTRTSLPETPGPSYNSYNLYLVYLAIPDLILNLYLLTMYGRYANQKLNHNFYGTIVSIHLNGKYFVGEGGTTFEAAFILACSTANLYLNCVVSYEILVLLRNIHQVVRCNPPSFLKVTLQAAAVYLFSITVFTIHYSIGRYYYLQSEQDDFTIYANIREKYSQLVNANFIWSIVVIYVFPILFIVCVSITIIFRRYMPSVTGKMKELVWFFFRIVFVFYLIWLPGIFFVVYSTKFLSSKNRGFWVQIGFLFCGIQPIVSTCMAMTKSDVRKYTMDLVTLSYIRKPSSSKETRTGNITIDSS